MAANATNGRLTLSDPSVKELAQTSCVHEKYYDALPKLQGEANWQEWSDALQHAALMAGTDAVLNGESKHPESLESKQCTIAEWNDNIKRTAVWRSRNESLLQAMRGAADVDLDDFGAFNAHNTYVGLRLRYHKSDNQRAFDIFSERLAMGYDLDDSPEEIANELQNAFNQYNQLVGDDTEQRLPENFLKMAFLESLDSGYDEWRRALLRERDVLALGQGSAMSFDELVELVVTEQAQLLRDLKRSITPVPAPLSQQAAKRNIAQVDEPAQLDLHRPCIVPHHGNGDHTNQLCMVQNPRLRYPQWRPNKADEIYLAEHPEIENPQLNKGSQTAFEDDSENVSESISESDFSCASGNQDEIRQQKSEGHNDTSASRQDGPSEEQNNNDEVSDHDSAADAAWKRFAAARYAEVQAQIDLVTQDLGGCKQPSRKARRHAPLVGDSSGKWLLYGKEHVSDTANHYRIQLWQATTEEQKQAQPNYRQYRASCLEHFRRLGGKTYEGEATFWGNGTMIVTIPAAVLGIVGSATPYFKFAGLHTKRVASSSGTDAQPDTGSISQSGNDRDGVSVHSRLAERLEDSGRDEASTGYDRVIRTNQTTNATVKVEQEDSDMSEDCKDQGSTAVAIKTEDAESSDSDDGWADDVAAIMDTVQKRKDSLRGGLVVRLDDLSGLWSFYSPEYEQEFGQGVQMFFYDRLEHDPSERMCAPGHCKPSADQIRYCGELRFKAKRGERDWSCLIKQFDVPKQASVTPVKIQSWDPLNKRAVLMTAWFLGGGAMSLSLSTTYIPTDRGQKTLITFSGVKSG